MSDATFEEVKRLIEQLPPREVKQLRAWLNNSHSKRTEPENQALTWGQRLAALIEDFPLAETDLMPVDDPEGWVREHRRTKTHRRNPGWGET